MYQSSQTDPSREPLSAQRWVGEIEWLTGGKRSVALIVNEVNRFLFGRMTIFNRNGNPQNFVEYQYGKRVSQDLVSLTSGLLQSRSLNHLRGRIENGKFRGVMIVGGRGVATKEFILTLDEVKPEVNLVRSVK